MTQHRFFVVRLRTDLAAGAARDHWTTRHGDVFLQTSGLRGYLQNRPLPDTGWVSSETVFDSRSDERTAFASDHYRDVVSPDEAFFLDRDSAYGAVVLDDSFLRGGWARFRAVLPGVEPEDLPDVGSGRQVYRLDRPVPAGGLPVVTFVWDDDEDVVRSAVDRTGGAAFVAESRVLRRPAGAWPWASSPQTAE